MNKEKILLLFDKSQGTKYENCKERFIRFFEDHFAGASASASDAAVTSFIMHIYAKNLVEGLLEIVRYCQNDEWVSKSVDELIKYHINGTAQYFK